VLVPDDRDLNHGSRASGRSAAVKVQTGLSLPFVSVSKNKFEVLGSPAYAPELLTTFGACASRERSRAKLSLPDVCGENFARAGWLEPH
jgi:hypothetical protein